MKFPGMYADIISALKMKHAETWTTSLLVYTDCTRNLLTK